MNESLPQVVNARKLTQAWVALSVARNLVNQYLKKSPQGDLAPLLKVLNVSHELMDEMLHDAFPLPTEELELNVDSEMVM